MALAARQRALVVLGTRPEAIKLAPVVRALKASGHFEVITCCTGQHANMVAPICEFFQISADYDLAVMRDGQSLNYVMASAVERLGAVFTQELPDLCIVQGDTTSALAGALSAFYSRVPVAHVEAGLRTGDLAAPWPEEGNRLLISRLAAFHFAPTATAERKLLEEGADPQRVSLTGNTVVDAALQARELLGCKRRRLAERFAFLRRDAAVVLFTMHRRESFGPPMERTFQALRRFCITHNVQVVFPVHPNPAVAGPARAILGAQPNVHLCDPLAYDELIYLLERCRFVVTDSGGLVEEAPTFHKPVLVLRDVTERPEAVDAGAAILCGASTSRLTELAEQLLEDGELFRSMSDAPNPFGDGHAADRIASYLVEAREREGAAA
jgi:UDP-N-acetylglucosamine 2-epimerase